jgi:outer membrane protein OmpA-like peptidoglycan-associated protein
MKKLLSVLSLSLLLIRLQAQCPDGLVASEQNLISNGDFEQNETAFTTDYQPHTVAEAGRYRIVSDAHTFWPGFIGIGDRNFLAVDGAAGANKIVWQQEMAVQKNTLYFFSAWVSNLYTIYPAVLQFSINGQLLDKPFHSPKERNKWEQFFVNWYSGQHQKAVITIVSQNPGSHGNDFGLDRLKFCACVASLLPKELQEVEPGKVIQLRNVLFETASAKILPTSFPELEQLVTYLREHPGVEIEIAGHTDNIGEENDNLELSQSRADAIGKYLTNKNITSKRLLLKGYGEQLPISSNETLEGRQRNRRVEFKIIKI